MTADKWDNGIRRPCSVDSPPTTVVLDTNVVLDWFVFDDFAVRPLAAAIETGQLHWLGTAETMRELDAVLARPGLERWLDRILPARELARRHCVMKPAPACPLAPALGLQCTDPDDQKFIDLAMVQRAQWLFSRDKALLRLARSALPYGVTVLRPVDWLR